MKKRDFEGEILELQRMPASMILKSSVQSKGYPEWMWERIRENPHVKQVRKNGQKFLESESLAKFLTKRVKAEFYQLQAKESGLGTAFLLTFDGEKLKKIAVEKLKRSQMKRSGKQEKNPEGQEKSCSKTCLECACRKEIHVGAC